MTIDLKIDNNWTQFLLDPIVMSKIAKYPNINQHDLAIPVIPCSKCGKLCNYALDPDNEKELCWDCDWEKRRQNL